MEDIYTTLKLKKLAKPIEEMTDKEARVALKDTQGNIAKLCKYIDKLTAQIAAVELKEKTKAAAKQGVVKASNKENGAMKPVAPKATTTKETVSKKK